MEGIDRYAASKLPMVPDGSGPESLAEVIRRHQDPFLLELADLARELQKITSTAGSLEGRFAVRLGQVVEETETAAHRRSEAALDEAIAETRALVRTQVTEELQAQFEKKLQDTVRQVNERWMRNLQAAKAEREAERLQFTDRCQREVERVMSQLQETIGRQFAEHLESACARLRLETEARLDSLTWEEPALLKLERTPATAQPQTA